MPAGFNDTEMRLLLEEAMLPLIRARQPEAIFLQCGADALEEDPLAKLSLSNNAHWAVVRGDGGALAPPPDRDRRRRLQPLYRRALLGRGVGDA